MPAGRAAVVAAAVLTVSVGLTGCGDKKSASSTSTVVATARSTSTATSAASATWQASQAAGSGSSTDASTGSSTRSSGGSSHEAGTCSAKQTSATIGGVHKCIEVGQMCSQKHAGDYTQYGFACEQDGNSWKLRKAS